MLKIGRIQFSEYRENKFLKAYGYYDFKVDLNKHNKEGILKINPIFSDEVYSWTIKKYFGKLKLKPKNKDFKIKFIDFKNSFLSLLRSYGALFINIELQTGQFHKNKEIVEVWGYRVVLLEKYAICEFLSSETVYNHYINKYSKPDYHKVYCGPDGKIFGWEKV